MKTAEDYSARNEKSTVQGLILRLAAKSKDHP
jgi:hypothetical protein